MKKNLAVSVKMLVDTFRVCSMESMLIANQHNIFYMNVIFIFPGLNPSSHPNGNAMFIPLQLKTIIQVPSVVLILDKVDLHLAKVNKSIVTQQK